MNSKFIWLSIVGVIISFAGGFLLANALNRSEFEKVQAENTRLQKEQSPATNRQPELDLSVKEIEEKLQAADQNPKDFSFQKGLGLALYRYASVKEDTKLLADVTKLLERANQINPDDYLVITSLGNLYYDLGQINKDSESNMKAREFYKKALVKNEKDANVRTDYGLTFLLTDNPSRELAIEEFEKALLENPKNEKALIYMTQAQLESENRDEANKYFAKLKEVNPNSEQISRLEGLMTQ